MIPLAEIQPDRDTCLVGGKGSGLGHLVRLGLPVPEGFCVTTAAYRAFVKRGFAAGRPAVPPRAFKRLGWDLGFAPAARARDLDAVQWAALWRLDRTTRRGRTVSA